MVRVRTEHRSDLQPDIERRNDLPSQGNEPGETCLQFEMEGLFESVQGVPAELADELESVDRSACTKARSSSVARSRVNGPRSTTSSTTTTAA